MMAADVPVQAPVEIAQAAMPPAAAPLTFDLRNYDIERAAAARLLDSRDCGGSGDEIVVCAPDQSKFRLKRDAAFSDDPRFDATMTILPNLTVTPHIEAAELQSGVRSNRVMISFKLKL